MGGKYFAAYKCQLCGKVVMYGEPAELPDDSAAHHKCKDGSAGIAMFSGFAKVK